MKTKYYHGTSADNLQSILKHGLSGTESKIWNVSEDGIYLWDALGCAKANCLEDEDESIWHNEAFRQANESAQIACAIATDCRCVVLTIEIDDSEVSPDFSCENMEGRGAVVCWRDIDPSEITDIQISGDLSLIKGYFMNILITHDYSNCEFTRLEKTIARCFKSSELIDYMDEIVQYEPYTDTTIKTL